MALQERRLIRKGEATVAGSMVLAALHLQPLRSPTYTDARPHRLGGNLRICRRAPPPRVMACTQAG